MVNGIAGSNVLIQRKNQIRRERISLGIHSKKGKTKKEFLMRITLSCD